MIDSSGTPKLAIVSTHPIQYNAPLFRVLSSEIGFQTKVFYTYSQGSNQFYDKDFQTNVQWDIPLLEDYSFTFVKNTSPSPSLSSYKGIICPSLISEIKEYGATHLLVYGWNFHAHFKVMRYFKGIIPVWFRGDSTLLDYEFINWKQVFSAHQQVSFISRLSSYLKFQLRTVILTYIYRWVDKAFYVGSHNKQYYLKNKLKETQLIYAPHAIDNARFFDSALKQYEKQAQEWRAELGISKDHFVIVFAGKLEPKKNPGLLLKAFQEISLQYPNTDLIFVGSGPLEKKLKQDAAVYKNIHFLPFQNQSKMPLTYRLGNLVCLPSQGPGETWGLAVNEALACNRPVLLSDKVGCSNDLIKDPKLIFESNNQYELFQKLGMLISDKETLSKENWQSLINNWNYSLFCDAIKNELKIC
nr:glycosyltransferase family 4 protein [uncultured Carboxylicivirga sp.]